MNVIPSGGSFCSDRSYFLVFKYGNIIFPVNRDIPYGFMDASTENLCYSLTAVLRYSLHKDDLSIIILNTYGANFTVQIYSGIMQMVVRPTRSCICCIECIHSMAKLIECIHSMGELWNDTFYSWCYRMYTFYGLWPWNIYILHHIL